MIKAAITSFGVLKPLLSTARGEAALEALLSFLFASVVYFSYYFGKTLNIEMSINKKTKTQKKNCVKMISGWYLIFFGWCLIPFLSIARKAADLELVVFFVRFGYSKHFAKLKLQQQKPTHSWRSNFCSFFSFFFCYIITIIL
jgi:hypothetical protein